MSTQQTFVIVGAGLAGAKAAEALRTNGFGGKVILIGDEAERPYDRPPLSKGYLLGTTEREKIYIHPAQWHLEHDIDLRLGTRVTEIDCTAHEVRTARGETLGYDKLLVTTGSSPRRLRCPVPTWLVCITCAGSPTAKHYRRPSPRRSGWPSSGRAGSAWRPRPPPGPPGVT